MNQQWTHVLEWSAGELRYTQRWSLSHLPEHIVNGPVALHVWEAYTDWRLSQELDLELLLE